MGSLTSLVRAKRFECVMKCKVVGQIGWFYYLAILLSAGAPEGVGTKLEGNCEGVS